MSKARALLLAATVVLAVLVAPAGAGTDRQTQAISASKVLNRALLAQVNAVRARRGLASLRLSRPLTAAARSHSVDMARLGFFSHSSPGGAAFWRRLERFYGSSGYRSWNVGEDLLWASPDVSPSRAVQLWMQSPGHRAVLLSPDWREVGLAAVHAASAPGAFQGREVTIVTADFGVRTR